MPHGARSIRPINELKIWARWKLGAALAKVERHQGPRPGQRKKMVQGVPAFWRWVTGTLELEKPRAVECQRIACVERDEVEQGPADRVPGMRGSMRHLEGRRIGPVVVAA